MQDLPALAAALVAVPNLTPNERGHDMMNLVDALQTLDFMEPADARAHARAHLGPCVSRVLAPLDREAPEVADRVRAFWAEVA